MVDGSEECDKVVAALADIYEGDRRNVGLDWKLFAQANEINEEIMRGLVAELKSEGSVTDEKLPGLLCFTDAGYSQYVGRVRALRQLSIHAR